MQNRGSAWLDQLEKRYALDARSLALFRIGLGALTICYLLQIYLNWPTYLGAVGIYPKQLLESSDWSRWSLFTFVPESLHLPIVGAAILAAFLLSSGILSRVAAFCILIVMLSIEHRNPMIIQVGTVLHRTLILWSIFLPLSDRFVVWPSRRRQSAKRINALACLGFLTQVSALYFFAFLYKWNGLWIWTGDGLFASLSYSPYVRPAGEWLLGFTPLLPFLTWVTQFMRLIGGIGPWISYRQNFLRGVLVAAFVLMHLLFALFLTIGLFPYVCIAMWTAMIPSSWWKWLKEKSTQTSIHALKPSVARLSTFICAILICMTLASNVVAFFPGTSGQLFLRIGKSVGTAQRWSMFATISHWHGWISVTNEYADGPDQPNLHFSRLGETRWRPISSLYQNEISRRYIENLVTAPRDDLIHAYGEFACRLSANDATPPRAIRLRLMTKTLQAGDLPPYQYVIFKQWEVSCR